jgi:His-Xaa-Ser system radical SAM maturase HxsB
LARQFYTIDTYEGPSTGYELFPFRFLHLNEDQDIIVNEVGEYLVVAKGTPRSIFARQVPRGSELYKTLKAKQFIFDSDSDPLRDVLAVKYRTKKSFLNGFTKLHIFVVTLRCDHSCHYCQVSRQTADRDAFDMSLETAERSLDLMMCAPNRNLTLEFQGGEPLLAFDSIKAIVPRAREKANVLGKNLEIVVVTNLANLTDDMLEYLRANDIKISTSLDGPAFIHNKNRPRPGNNSYELTIANLNKARSVLGVGNVSAMMTTTLLSLDYPIEIIDEYVQQGFRTVFLRPLSPYGFAVKSKHKTGYEMDRFLSFYKTGLEHLLRLNKSGIPIAEFYTTMLLTKMLTPYATSYVDLQSPAGAGTSVLVYNYDGKVYATDESRMLAEMHDTTFQLGSVHDTHRDLVTGNAYRQLMAASVNEALPGCVDCAFQSYCGADPVFHHATQGDLFGHRPTSAFCHRNMEVLKYLFNLLENGGDETRRILMSWVSGLSPFGASAAPDGSLQ